VRTRAVPPRRFLAPSPRPFPTRGVPGGWSDPWDGDPRDAAMAAPRCRADPGRCVAEAGQRVELAARGRADGRWEAHVSSWERADPGTEARAPTPGWVSASWPSVNGPTAAAALDVLEAELRGLIRGTPAGAPRSQPAPAG
jgi:hypothetical protein